MYNQSYTADFHLPPGAAPSPRARQSSSNLGSVQGSATPPSLPKPRSVNDDLYASIEQHLRNFAPSTPGVIDDYAPETLLGSTRNSLNSRASPPLSFDRADDSPTETGIISLYGYSTVPESPARGQEGGIEAARSYYDHDQMSPTAREVSPIPSTLAYRTPTDAAYSPTASQASIRRSNSRPLPPTPQQRITSGGSKSLASLTEGTQVDAPTSPLAGSSKSVYTSPVSQRSAGAWTQSPNGRLSIESNGRMMPSGSHYSPSSPAPDPFDPTTGRVLRKTSYDHSQPSMSPYPSYSPFGDENGLRRATPTSPPSMRSPSSATVVTRSSFAGKRPILTRATSPREEAVPGHLKPALLSHIAMFVKDRVPRAEHTRGAVPYLNSFTGQDLVVRFRCTKLFRGLEHSQNTIQRALPDSLKADRRIGLQVARSLHSQLFFFDMRDNTGQLRDTLDGVYMFLDEQNSVHAPSNSSSSKWTPSVLLEDIPTAVQTEITPCYSAFCNRISALGYSGGCYSPSCPNSSASLLRRQNSNTSETAGTIASQASSDVPWVATVPPELLPLLGEMEIKRQNEIHELIAGESDYVRDIDILRTEFLEPLTEADPAIIISDEQPAFFAEVLLNSFEIREHASAFSEALQHRQREQGPVIQSIGDVVLAAAIDWSAAYLDYATDYPFAEARLKREQASNPAFDAFMTSFMRRAKTRKLPMLHYQTRVTVRLQRYILLLDGIRRHTPAENPDLVAIEQAIALLMEQCRKADHAVAASALRLACRGYERDLVERPGTSFVRELELSSDERTIKHRGRMLRKPESSSFTDWTELFVILLDNYFIMTKPRAQGRNGDTKYHISRRPVPLELLTIFSYEDGPAPRSSGFHLPRSNTESSVSNSRDERLLWPITFQYLGRDGGIFTLYAESSKARDEWREKLQAALGARQMLLQASRVLEVVPLCQDAFFMRQHAHEQATLRDGIRSIGRPSCSVAFQTPEGHQLVAIGHDDGLWIGLRHDPSSFRLVLHLKLITQCAVLQDFALVLVLADKALYAYPLEALVPSAASSVVQREKEPQKLSGTKDVLFFRAGKVGPRLLVIYVKKSGVQTVFKALEPIAPNDRSKASLLKRRPDWFRTYKDFFLPSETFSIVFLRTYISIVCAKGFELLSLEQEPLKMTSFPDWPFIARNDARSVEVAKRCGESRAIAMFRLDEAEFLFVYEDLAIYSDRHGDPIPSRYDDIIDWHGRPRHVVLVRPFLVAFDQSFIEIRHAHTGKLVQIIKARDVLCTFEGTGGASQGLGTGESERRPHVTYTEKGRHMVAELVPVDSRGG